MSSLYTSLLLTAGAYQGFCLTVGFFMLIFAPRLFKGCNAAALRMAGIALLCEAASSIFIRTCETQQITGVWVDDISSWSSLVVLLAVMLMAHSLTTAKMPAWKEWGLVLAPFIGNYIVMKLWPSTATICTTIGSTLVVVMLAASFVLFMRHDRRLKERVADDLRPRYVMHFIIVFVSVIATQAMWVLPGLMNAKLYSISIAYFLFMFIVWIYLCVVLALHKTDLSDGSDESAVLYEDTDLRALGAQLDQLAAKQPFYLASDVSRDSLAKLLGVDRQQLSAYLSLNRHETFYDYINGLRTEHAKRLLKDAKLTLEDVARQCGYESVRSFERAFTKAAGVSPAAWRKH